MAVSSQPDSVGSDHGYPSQVTLEPLDASDPNQVAEVLQVCGIPLVDDSPASNFQGQVACIHAPCPQVLSQPLISRCFPLQGCLKVLGGVPSDGELNEQHLLWSS